MTTPLYHIFVEGVIGVANFGSDWLFIFNDVL